MGKVGNMSGHLGENLQLGFGQVWRTLEGGDGGHPELEAGCHTSQTLSTGSIIYLIRHETHPGSTGSLGGQLGESDKGQGRNSLPFGPIQTERKGRQAQERTHNTTFNRDNSVLSSPGTPCIVPCGKGYCTQLDASYSWLLLQHFILSSPAAVVSSPEMGPM